MQTSARGLAVPGSATDSHMTTRNSRPPTGRKRPRWGLILAAVGVLVVVAITVIVLVLAGGEQTGDGTGRQHQSSETVNTTGTAITTPKPAASTTP